MADNDNTITLVGRIGQEPELRGTSRGEVCSFTLATSDRRRAADGSWSDGPTSWFRVAAWGDLARHAHASLHRGQQVIVRGIVSVQDFQLENGGRSKSVELRATALGHDLRWGTTTFVDGGRQAAAPATTQATAAPPVEQERGDGWAASAPAPAEPREPVPVGAAAPAGDWGSGLGSEDVPF
ncbi:single-stranded DNA-binding protein [Amnibacterium kyonggiense]|uniref:Single-stranded DNA-binding protein n=1 Tax=Amnibacterium kyonggiense TaxID=595671 RepID=A0A4R7FT87_9MICO|nr:single-stranded DNA-binding protein [Amnibacterium kyonggiense]TDS81093.1 single-strand DNA-binding protein [Amnibacterium kyonggiense]